MAKKQSAVEVVALEGVEVLEEVKVPEVPKQPTIIDLITEIGKAYNAGDFETVKKLSTEVAKAQKAAEKVAEDAEKLALSGLTNQIKGKIMGVLDELEFPELAQGVWFVWDFEKTDDEAVTCKLRRAVSRPGTGGGAGKTGSKTSELLGRFGDVAVEKDIHTSEATGRQSVKGMTYGEAFKLDTDGNFRYSLKKAMDTLTG